MVPECFESALAELNNNNNNLGPRPTAFFLLAGSTVPVHFYSRVTDAFGFFRVMQAPLPELISFSVEPSRHWQYMFELVFSSDVVHGVRCCRSS